MIGTTRVKYAISLWVSAENERQYGANNLKLLLTYTR